jgi:hypothetical protein
VAVEKLDLAHGAEEELEVSADVGERGEDVVEDRSLVAR